MHNGVRWLAVSIVAGGMLLAGGVRTAPVAAQETSLDRLQALLQALEPKERALMEEHPIVIEGESSPSAVPELVPAPADTP